MKPRVFHWSKNLLRLCFCNKNLCKERKGGRGETEEQNPASRLSMINKHTEEGCAVGGWRKEVIMWQRMIFLLKTPLGRRKQENMRILPVHTMTLQSTMGNPLMKSFSNASCQLGICQIPFASNHSETVAWPKSAPSFSGAKLQKLGAGVCESRPVPIFMVRREMEMLTNLP